MIGTIDIEIMAANPSMPLHPLRAFVNSPSSIRLRNVPKKIGTWQITSVQIVAAYPNGAIKTANCVLTGGVWVGTIEGCPISGRSKNGFTVFASGIDENGNPVSNYVLGKGLIEILKADGTITPDAPSYYVHLLDEEPEEPREGDLWPELGYYMIWQDGQAHQFGGFTPTDPQLAAINSGITAALIPVQATSSNPLADKAFVNSSVQTATANFRGNWATWTDVPTEASGYPPDYTGSRTPTTNDYLVVQDASGYPSAGEPYEGTWRFKYSGDWSDYEELGWYPEYQVNETPMTAAQLAALNSNITAEKVAQYDNTIGNISYELYTPAKNIDLDWTLSGLPEGATNVVGPTYGELVWVLSFYYDNEHYTGILAGTGDETSLTIACDPTYDLTKPIVTVTATREKAFGLKDRAVNLMSIDTSTAEINVVFPDPITDHARDFMVRIVASAGTYGTAPTLNMSGVTLMNADGEMPEIKTDTTNVCTTIFYFSEIASHMFLVKGEQLEAITL